MDRRSTIPWLTSRSSTCWTPVFERPVRRAISRPLRGTLDPASTISTAVSTLGEIAV